MQFYVTSRSGETVVPDAAASGGMVIQKITLTYDVTDCVTGARETPPDPVFYEAFPIRDDGMSGTANDDSYDQWKLDKRDGKRGSIKIVGEATFHRSLRPGEMAHGAVASSLAALSSLTPPANLASPTLTREMTVSWDCCAGGARHSSIDVSAANSWGNYTETWRWRFPAGLEHDKRVNGRRVE